MQIVYSRNNVPVRLTEERWFHIVENHDELAGGSQEVLETVNNPNLIVGGTKEELLAVRRIENKRWIVVVYKELNNKDGFIITAFTTSKIGYLIKKEILWTEQ